MTPTHEPFRKIHPSLQLTSTLRDLQLKLGEFRHPCVSPSPYFVLEMADCFIDATQAFSQAIPTIRRLPDLLLFLSGLLTLPQFLLLFSKGLGKPLSKASSGRALDEWGTNASLLGDPPCHGSQSARSGRGIGQ
jgi:hypothetical protein